jgi:hypothetical protein
MEELLKIKISDTKMIGFHLILCRLGMKQLSEEHVRIDYDAGIKRYLYDNAEKRINLADFLKFLQQNFKKPPNIPHLIEIEYEEPNTPLKILPFTVDNLTGVVETDKVKHSFVRAKKGVELNMVSIKEAGASKRKPSQGLD